MGTRGELGVIVAVFAEESKLENGVESAMDSYERGDLADRKQGSIRVGACAVSRVVSNRQALIRHPEDDLSANDVTRQAKGVNLGP